MDALTIETNPREAKPRQKRSQLPPAPTSWLVDGDGEAQS